MERSGGLRQIVRILRHRLRRNRPRPPSGAPALVVLAGLSRPIGESGPRLPKALACIVKESRLDPALIDRADAVVVDELTDLVLHRYRRAPAQAKCYITRLVSAATQMGRAA